MPGWIKKITIAYREYIQQELHYLQHKPDKDESEK